MAETNGGLSALSDGWVWTTLGEICESALKTQPKERPKVEFTYIDIASIDNHLSKIVNPKIYVGKDAPSRARQVVRTGDILFSTVRTYLKNIALVSDRYDGQIASTGFCIIRPLIAATEFIFWMTLSNGFLSPLNKIQRGTSYPAVRDSDVFSQIVPLPPENEQIRIVAKIEELFTKLDAGKEELLQAKARLKRYRQSVLKAAMDGKLTEDWRKKHGNEIEPASVLLERMLKERREKWEAEQLAKYTEQGKTPPKNWRDKYKKPKGPDTPKLPLLPEGWEWANVQQISKVSGGLTKNSKRNIYPKKLPYLRVANVYADELRLEEIKRIGVKEEELNRVLLKDGDMLVVEGNGSPDQIGRVAIWNGSISPCAHQNHIIKARFDPVEIGMYCIYWLLSIEGRKYISQVASSTSGLYTLSISKVQALPVPIPPLREQQVIIEEIDRSLSVADAVEATVDAELKRSDALRQSILKQAFSGKLVPQDLNDEPASVLLERIKEDKMKRESEQKSKRKSKKKRKREQGHTKIDDLLSEKKRNTKIYDALKSVGQPLPPDKLLELSKLDVDEFYAQLKTEIENGRMVERRPDKTSVFLEIKNET